MARLLVLALAETTRNPATGYQVIARNLDDNSWVIIPTLPKKLLFNSGKVAWDIFGVTEADITPKPYENRSGVYEVSTNTYIPKIIAPPIIDNNERNKMLYSLSDDNKQSLEASSEWVGLLRDSKIVDLKFRQRHADRSDFNPRQTFYWECRIDFEDKYGSSWGYRTTDSGVACKDMRFKAYWRDICLSERNPREKKIKWLKYMQDNPTYLLIEFLPKPPGGSGYTAMISGVLSIKSEVC